MKKMYKIYMHKKLFSHQEESKGVICKKKKKKKKNHRASARLLYTGRI